MAFNLSRIFGRGNPAQGQASTGVQSGDDASTNVAERAGSIVILDNDGETEVARFAPATTGGAQGDATHERLLGPEGPLNLNNKNPELTRFQEGGGQAGVVAEGFTSQTQPHADGLILDVAGGSNVTEDMAEIVLNARDTADGPAGGQGSVDGSVWDDTDIVHALAGTAPGGAPAAGVTEIVSSATALDKSTPLIFRDTGGPEGDGVLSDSGSGQFTGLAEGRAALDAGFTLSDDLVNEAVGPQGLLPYMEQSNLREHGPGSGAEGFLPEVNDEVLVARQGLALKTDTEVTDYAEGGVSGYVEDEDRDGDLADRGEAAGIDVWEHASSTEVETATAGIIQKGGDVGADRGALAGSVHEIEDSPGFILQKDDVTATFALQADDDGPSTLLDLSPAGSPADGADDVTFVFHPVPGHDTGADEAAGLLGDFDGDGDVDGADL